ncbi:MAG: AbrB family transcriptional regulator [Beijerinckiaceae bacterium]
MIGHAAHLRPLLELAPAFLGALFGGFLFTLIGLPAPWISGGMLGAMMSALVRPLPVMPDWLRDFALLLAGATMGASVTPDTVALMSKAPLSFLVLGISILATVYFSSIWLSRFHGWNREDAILAAAPGALSAVLSIGAARGGDVVGIAVVQTMRLFVIVALLPGVIGWLEGAGPAPIIGPPTMNEITLLLMLAGGFICSIVFGWMKLAASTMLGAAIFGAVLHGAGWAHGQMPAPVAILGFVLIGVMIATRTRGITWRAVGRYAAASVASFVISVFVGAAGAFTAGLLVGVRPGAALLAFAPGGVEAMTLLSISLAYDPIYVAAHHILRFMGIGFFIPIYFRFLDRSADKSPDGSDRL